jgi:hypothetical protein
VAINDRLQRLEDEWPEPACEEQPCQRAPAFTQWERREDGSLALVKGTPPPPLCERCPARESNLVRHVMIMRAPYSGDDDQIP